MFLASTRPSFDLPLISARLSYRELTPDDWQFIYSYWQKETFYRYRAVPVPTPEYVKGEVQKYVAHRHDSPRRDYYFLICSKPQGIPVGIVSTRIGSDDSNSSEIGFSIHHDYWGLGYATEAGQAIIQYSAGQLGISKITAKAIAANLASHRVLMKLGFADLGYVENPKEVRGTFPPARHYLLDLSLERVTK